MRIRHCLAVLLMFVSLTAAAFQPRTGHWWNPVESGRGFNIDIQDGVMVLTAYTYDGSGNPQWYLATAPMTNGQHNFSATLDKYRGGQCVTCAYSPATVSGNDGVVSVAFRSETSATVTLPGGHVSTIQPLNFKYGEPPNGMLGQWIFIEQIGALSFADRFDYSTLMTKTAAGNGIATDAGRLAGCELQVSGSSAGLVLCVDVSPTGTTQNLYSFRYGLDETFDGLWISPTTGGQFPMKGFRVKSGAGFPKASVTETHESSQLKANQAMTATVNAAPDDLMSALNALAQKMRLE